MDVAKEKLRLARKHLSKVQAASWEPIDWADLSVYGFLALENAVVAAAAHLGIPWKPTHPDKLEAAITLHSQRGLPDIRQLLKDLNELRKSESYGDVEAPGSYSAEDIAAAVEDYVEKVSELVAGQMR